MSEGMRMERPWYMERAQQRLLQSPSRRRILEKIRAVPGIHLRRLARELGMALGTIEPHLRALESHQLVISRRGGNVRSYFARDQTDGQDLRLLQALRNRTYRRILLEILKEPGIGFSALAGRVPRGTSTTAYHLGRLQNAGVVERAQVGRHAYYRLTEPHRVLSLLEEFRGTFRGLEGYEQFLAPAGDGRTEPEEPGPSGAFEGLLDRTLRSGVLVRATRGVPEREAIA